MWRTRGYHTERKNGTVVNDICRSAPQPTVNRACTGAESEGSVSKDFLIFNNLV